jgi:hypothetical protein
MSAAFSKTNLPEKATFLKPSGAAVCGFFEGAVMSGYRAVYE